MNRRNLLKTVLGGLASLLLPVKFTQAKVLEEATLLRATVTAYLCNYAVVYDSVQKDLISFYKEAIALHPYARTYKIVINEKSHHGRTYYFGQQGLNCENSRTI
jgi:hypothetical protein